MALGYQITDHSSHPFLTVQDHKRLRMDTENDVRGTIAIVLSILRSDKYNRKSKAFYIDTFCVS